MGREINSDNYGRNIDPRNLNTSSNDRQSMIGSLLSCCHGDGLSACVHIKLVPFSCMSLSCCQQVRNGQQRRNS